MNKYIFLILGIALLLFSCTKTESVIVKPRPVTIGDDSYSILQQDFMTNFKSNELIKVYNSEEIKIEETFCYIGNKDSIICISNVIKALTPSLVTKIIRARRGGLETIVVTFKKDDFIYNFSYFKTKDQYGAEEFVLNGDVELYFKGKVHSIPASTTGVCKLLVK